MDSKNSNPKFTGERHIFHYTFLFDAYDAKHLREEYGISKKDELRDFFNPEELQQVQKAEMLVSGLVEYGWGYDEIKDFILNRLVGRIAV